VFLTLSSCQYFEKQVPDEKQLLDSELKQVNWNQVDEYPSISDCDSLTDKELRKQCFFEFLASNIQLKLNNDKPLKSLYPELDTIEVKVTVMPDSSILFEPQFLQDSVTYDKVKIDSILKTRLVDFPKINPAIKRGIPVKTQFILPVIIKTK
jgi:hypothetical protein